VTRVLAVIDSLVPGGAESSLAAIAPHLPPLGIELAVAYFHERPGVRDELVAAGAELFAVGGSTRRQWYAGTRRVIEGWRPDLVHTTLFEADVIGRVAARRTRTPVVSSLVNEGYGPGFERGGGAPWKLRSAQLVDALTARLVTRFHAVTGSVADTMTRRLHLPRERVDVVHRGRDPDALGRRTEARSQATRAQVGVGDGPLLVAAGRQEYQKGFDVLLTAFPEIARQLPGATLFVAGRPGRATPALERQRAALGEGVRFLGHRPDLPDLLAAADVFVLPSRWEGAAGVVLEAMALEAPIVATDLVGVREVVGSTAALVPPEDPPALAAAVASAVLDGTAQERAVAARERFLDRFTVERSASGMAAFYRRALADRGS
jgi:glycosyltransferase involved in cell wall biosynthesis